MRKNLILLSPLAALLTSSVVCFAAEAELSPVTQLVNSLVEANSSGETHGIVLSKDSVMMAGAAPEPARVLAALTSSGTIVEGTIESNEGVAESFVLKAKAGDAISWQPPPQSLAGFDQATLVSGIEEYLENSGCSIVSRAVKREAATFRTRCNGDIPDIVEVLGKIESAGGSGLLDGLAIYPHKGTATTLAHVDLRFSLTTPYRTER